MAATAEPPPNLEIARRALDDLNAEIVSIGPWQRVPTNPDRWQLAFALRPNGLDPAGPIPARTWWYALVSDDYPSGSVSIVPAKDHGISDTFAHQAVNEPGDAANPWRLGQLCLVESIDGHELAAARDEDRSAKHRLFWHVQRGLDWLRDASHDRLIRDGDPFELPWFGAHKPIAPMVAFHEGPETFARWAGISEQVGLVDLVSVRSGINEVVGALAFRDLTGRMLVAPTWGKAIIDANVLPSGLWFRFDELPVRRPWRAPQSWRELTDWAAERGIDLTPRLRRATSAIRDGLAHYVLLSFPIPGRKGEEAFLVHWVGFRLPALTNNRRRTAVPGFRTQHANWVADRSIGILAPDAVLDWVRTENWHPDQLATRGRLGGGLAGRRIALIGAGVLGSNLAELFVRAGVQDLAIIDGGLLEAGNLVRHTLTLDDIGLPKANRLERRLNRVNPNTSVTGFYETFPTTDPAANEALQVADIIIDATGSEAVIEAMAAGEWKPGTIFVSVSFSFGAERLYLYLVEGAEFPIDDFRRRTDPWVQADARPITDFPWRGVGCWSAVFPARADDVAVLVATGIRQIDERLRTAVAAPDFRVFQRHADGSVTRRRHPLPRLAQRAIAALRKARAARVPS